MKKDTLLFPRITGGSEGLPGDQYVICHISVTQHGTRHRAEIDWEAGSNQGYLQCNERKIAIAWSDDLPDLLDEIRDAAAEMKIQGTAFFEALHELKDAIYLSIADE